MPEPLQVSRACIGASECTMLLLGLAPAGNGDAACMGTWVHEYGARMQARVRRAHRQEEAERRTLACRVRL